MGWVGCHSLPFAVPWRSIFGAQSASLPTLKVRAPGPSGAGRQSFCTNSWLVGFPSSFTKGAGDGEISRVAAVSTAMLPLVNVIGGHRFLADKPVNTSFTPVTNVFDLYGGNITTDSGEQPKMIEKVPCRLDLPCMAVTAFDDNSLFVVLCGYKDQSDNGQQALDLTCLGHSRLCGSYWHDRR